MLEKSCCGLYDSTSSRTHQAICVKFVKVKTSYISDQIPVLNNIGTCHVCAKLNLNLSNDRRRRRNNSDPLILHSRFAALCHHYLPLELMSRSHFRVKLPLRRSALGINRISDVEIAQVLHASHSDIDILQSQLRKWGVSDFRSYPLLLRALTHPSISNWAERVLNLPKRSLGPNTLELLGDRVVGACAAYHVLDWTRQKPLRSDIDWAGGPHKVLKSLIGNRGLAEVARTIGIEPLIRWEKPLPPASHRSRLDSLGIDIATGVQSNVEVNGLAAAYESVAAAIYLDGGFEPALSFVNSTLLRQPIDVQHNNRESSDYEAILSSELAALFETPVTFVSSRSQTSRKTVANGKTIITLLDFHQEPSDELNEAHALFYAGVSIRRASDALGNLDESSLLSLASHFSVETARLAALTHAIAIVRGEVPFEMDQSRQTLRDERIVLRNSASHVVPLLTVKVNSLGQWQFNRDYAHVASVLGKAGLHVFEAFETLDADRVRTVLQSRCSQRAHDDNKKYDNNRVNQPLRSAKDLVDVDAMSPHSQGNGSEALSGLDAKAVENTLQIGREVIADLELSRTHPVLLENVRPGADVVNCLDNAVHEISCLEWPQRMRCLNGYHALGKQSLKLWAVQRSIDNVAEDRANIVPRYEHRVGLAHALEQALTGPQGLQTVRDSGVRAGCVALGMCVERVGMSTALSWLTGEEATMN